MSQNGGVWYVSLYSVYTRLVLKLTVSSHLVVAPEHRSTFDLVAVKGKLGRIEV